VGSGYRGLLETADEGARPSPSGHDGCLAEARRRIRVTDVREAQVPRHPPACSAKALATLTNDNAGCPSSATRVFTIQSFRVAFAVASRQSRKG